jgi:DNA replicative helicase MCM subunit Mcm2 (Cdc46/Mcm family)
VAKAGIICKVNTRTTIIAATNPTCNGQKWNPQLDLIGNTGIQTSLLSRFDLIFIMLDDHDGLHDLKKAEHVLQYSCVRDESIKNKIQDSKQTWSVNKLRRYISLV